MKDTNRFSFFKKKFSFMHLCMTMFVSILFFTFIVLVIQYRSLKTVTTQLCELKEEYRVYTISLKKMVDQQSSEHSKRPLEEEKKKENKSI